MSNVSRSNTTTVALVAALVVPRIQRATGVVLSIDDVAALMAVAVAVWHAGASLFERYFPPPNPTTPAAPAGETK